MTGDRRCSAWEWGADMSAIRMFQVDAFADQVFAGNPAAVLVLDDWLPDRLMQSIAEENNLAETAFLRPAQGGWDIRWFTPVHEAEFCGHATVAAAHILCTERGIAGDIAFFTRVGELRVRASGKDYQLHMPRFEPEIMEEPPREVAHLFGDERIGQFKNFENVFIELAREEAVRSFVPDVAAITRLFPMGLAITAAGAEADFVSRYFAPGAGIPEDPVTGSTHATLVPYWAGKLGKSRLSAVQCSARGGRLVCELEDGWVSVSGHAVTFMRAEIFLPAM